MNKYPKKRFTSKNATSDIDVDEEIEVELYDDLNHEKSSSHSKTRIPTQQQTQVSKSTLAGIFLIIAFFLSLIFPISFMVAVYDIETATGDTTLKGHVLDSRGNPVNNVMIEILDVNLSTTTADNGKYSFDKVPVGEHEIQFTKSGYRKITVKKVLFSKSFLTQSEEEDNIINIPGNLSSGIEITPFEGPFSQSDIIDDNFNNTIFGTVTNTSGASLENIMILVDDTNISTITDENGDYLLKEIPPGVITISVEKSGNDKKTTIKFLYAFKMAMQLNITYHEENDWHIDNVQEKTGEINGTISDKKGSPIAGATVKLNRQSDSDLLNKTMTISNVSTDENGEFLIKDVPIGVYDISVMIEDYYIFFINNITVNNNSKIMLPVFELKKIDEPIVIEEEISNPYTYACIIILFILSVIILLGAISAFQKKRYSLAFIGSLCGMFPIILVLQVNICGASIVSLIGLVLLVFSRDEFDLQRNNSNT
jgi:protocatechuate 3,4-dioxygenase beta subunit